MQDQIFFSCISGLENPSSAPVENGWNKLGLAYAVDWPLHILFTKPVLEK